MASAIFSPSVFCVVVALADFWMPRAKANRSYSFQVTSALLIQNGRILTGCCGPSSAKRWASVAGLPIINVPPGIGTMSNLTLDPGNDSVYGCISGAGTMGPALAMADVGLGS